MLTPTPHPTSREFKYCTFVTYSNYYFCEIIIIRDSSILVVFVLPYEFTYSANTNFERVSFLNLTGNRRIYEIRSPQILRKKPTYNENWPQRTIVYILMGCNAFWISISVLYQNRNIIHINIIYNLMLHVR